ncbi:MAG TPA: TIM barrel protein [Thermomicrobiales bacterium]|nr:TIM barrel protein [Thermomicrobiales bacterium]
MMQTVLFTKLFRGRTLDEIAEHGAGLGFDGIDLLIRNGHQVTPGEPDGLAGAAARLQAAGLSVPMATTDLTDPNWSGAARLLAACADAGIGTIRLGYWKYDPAVGYAAQFDAARRDLDGLSALARAAGVQLAIQLHGGTLHGSGAQTRALLEGHDPQFISAYPDPGNQVVQDGREDWRFTFDVLRPWLSCVGVKNGGWFAGDIDANGQRRWRSDWLGLADGMVPWDDILAFLAEERFDGLLTLHSHYEVPFDQVIDQTRADLRYVRRQIGASEPALASA